MQQSELTGTLSQTITVLSEISQGYTPRHFEPRFGMGNPSLTLQTEIGKVRLHGYIDRIDESPDGSLRIIDYKAGSATISSRDLEDGRRLQLPIYALAARMPLIWVKSPEVFTGISAALRPAASSSKNIPVASRQLLKPLCSM